MSIYSLPKMKGFVLYLVDISGRFGGQKMQNSPLEDLPVQLGEGGSGVLGKHERHKGNAHVSPLVLVDGHVDLGQVAKLLEELLDLFFRGGVGEVADEYAARLAHGLFRLSQVLLELLVLFKLFRAFLLVDVLGYHYPLAICEKWLDF